MQFANHETEANTVRLYLNDPYNEEVANIMYKLHKIPSSVPNMSVAEYVFAKLVGESISIVDAIDADCYTIFTDFYILSCLKNGNEAALDNYNENDLISFYHILGGRIDFVKTLHNHGFSMIGLIEMAITNNDVQLIAHILDNKLYDARNIIGSLTTDNITGDVQQAFAYIERRGAFYTTNDVDNAILLFVNTDNLIMMKWMDMRGMLSHNKSAMGNLFVNAVYNDSISIAKWLAINGNYEQNYSLVKVYAGTENYEEMMKMLKKLYKL